MISTTENPSLHYFYPAADGTYPKEPFWDMLISTVGWSSYYTFMKGGPHFGFGSFDKWKDNVNANPSDWEVSGTRSSFMFLPKPKSAPTGLAAMTPVRVGITDGIEWKIVLTPRGSHLNGYVLIPYGHPLRGLDYTEIEGIDIHRGLTFSEDDWIGFDTAHYGDFWKDEELEKVGGKNTTMDPLLSYVSPSDHVQIWTLEKLEQETKYLARQVAAYV